MLQRLESYLSWWNGLDKTARDRFLHDLRTKNISDRKKAEIKALAKHFLHKDHVSWNCGSCIMDAHILIVRLKLENMKKTQEYVLYPGTILHDPINKDFDLILMPPTLTEGLALYHLAFNRRAAKYFVTKPADVDKRIADYLAGLDEDMRAKALPSAIEAFEKYGAETEQSKPKAGKGRKPKGEPKAPEATEESETETEPEQEPETETEPEQEPETEAPAEQEEA